jgi:NADH-quinone oxidoreductase subunit H
MSSMSVVFFFGGWLPFSFLNIFPYSFVFALKILFFLFLFICVRASVPRYRYDQLMNLGWKLFLPLSLSFLFFSSVFFYFMN